MGGLASAFSCTAQKTHLPGWGWEKLVLTLALILTFSPGEKEQVVHAFLKLDCPFDLSGLLLF